MTETNAKKRILEIAEDIKNDGLLKKYERLDLAGQWILLADLVNDDAMLSSKQEGKIIPAVKVIQKMHMPAQFFQMISLATYINSCK